MNLPRALLACSVLVMLTGPATADPLDLAAVVLPGPAGYLDPGASSPEGAGRRWDGPARHRLEADEDYDLGAALHLEDEAGVEAAEVAPPPGVADELTLFPVQEAEPEARPKPGYKPPRAWVQFGLGTFVVRRAHGIDTGRLEFWSRRRVFKIARLFTGLSWGRENRRDRAALIYTGFYWDFKFGKKKRKVHLIPSTSVAALVGGNNLRFSGDLQFRSGLEVAFDVGDRGNRIGVAWMHVSNANVHLPNLGSDSWMLTWTTPID